MDSEVKILMEKILSLVEENNRMLHKVRRVQRRQYYWGAFKFVVIVGVALGLFYFLEPFINKTINVVNQITGIKQPLDVTSLQDILKKF